MTFEFDYRSAEAFLVGYCHKTIGECMFVSMEEFRHLSEAHERREQLEMEHLRWLAFHNLATIPFPNKAAMPTTLQDYVRFPWEKENTRKAVTSGALSEADVAELYRLYQLNFGNQS